MPMIRAWLYPIFTSVPSDIRYSGMIPMSAYAAIDPLSWLKPPFYGIIVYVMVWWWMWNNNTFGLIRAADENWQNNKWEWLLRNTFWSIIFNPIFVFLAYLAVLGAIRIASIKFGAY